MDEIFEKTRHHILYVCTNLECMVSTFIGNYMCPMCEKQGTIARQPYDGRGAPGWVKKETDD
jgi:hypothetical protein